jgi:hypothetical protein
MLCFAQVCMDVIAKDMTFATIRRMLLIVGISNGNRYSSGPRTTCDKRVRDDRIRH